MRNELFRQLVEREGYRTIAIESDCREGICGTCGFMINGVAHGPNPATTVCQLHMRFFKDGDTLVLEPWRAAAFPSHIPERAVARVAAAAPVVPAAVALSTALSASLGFLLFGEGNVPQKVRELLMKAEPNPERRPRVIVG